MNTAYLLKLPWVLIAARLAIAPVLLVTAAAEAPRILFAVMLPIALWLDIVDGVCARKLGVDTPALRRADSWADVAFFLSVAASIWLAEPAIFGEIQGLLLLLIVCEIACQLLSFVRFGCSTSTHTWLCKSWAVMLFFSATLILGKGIGGWHVLASLGWGLLAYVEVLLILSLSRQSPVDVPTVFQVWQMTGHGAEQGSPATVPEPHRATR